MWESFFKIHDETVFDHLKQNITTISRNSNHVDVFTIGFDNAVWTSWWEPNTGWAPWFQIHKETVFDHNTQRITAIQRGPNHIDLFVIGFDNVVWSSWWEPNTGWAPWFQIHKETVFDHTTQQVTAISRNSGRVDLFVIGFDNAVWSTWWGPNSNWAPWFQIHKETIFDYTKQKITALSRSSDHLDLFVIGFDNAVWTTWWEPNTSWVPWFQIHKETTFDHTTQRVAALSRDPNHVDLFVIGFDNAVWTTYWQAGSIWQPWFQIRKETVFDHTTQQINALSRKSDHVDLFVIGFDNAVWSTWWGPNSSWAPWFQIHKETTFDYTTQRIASVSRNEDHVDLFVIGYDNAVWSTWWGPNPPGTAEISADGKSAVFELRGVTSDQPLGGSVRVVVDRTGAFTFSGVAHDSSADNIDYSIAAILMLPSGIAFTFNHSGSVKGTFHGLDLWNAPARDAPWLISGSNPQLAADWDQMAGAKLTAKLTGTDTLVNGIKGEIDDLIQEAIKNLGKVAVAAVIALVL